MDDVYYYGWVLDVDDVYVCVWGLGVLHYFSGCFVLDAGWVFFKPPPNAPPPLS
jgi:hypothetical protein